MYFSPKCVPEVPKHFYTPKCVSELPNVSVLLSQKNCKKHCKNSFYFIYARDHCPTCTKIVLNGLKGHRCDEYLCNTCNRSVPIDSHQCFIRALDKPEPMGKNVLLKQRGSTHPTTSWLKRYALNVKTRSTTRNVRPAARP